MLEGSDGVKMKAVVLSEVTPYDMLTVSEVTIPKVKPGWVLVKINAFGLNHSELVLRRHEISADYIKKPIIPGIECVGVIEDGSDSQFIKGDKVVALMGGMGRSFDGSYAEYALLPSDHVFSAHSDMDFTTLAAIPETFYTAYGSLVQGLQLSKEDVLLVRGGTSALGLAAIQLAKAFGTYVIATTRQPERLEFLESVGADEAVLDNQNIFKFLKTKFPKGITKVLELVSAGSLPYLEPAMRQQGIVCVTGQLGKGGNPMGLIKAIPNGIYVTSFHSNYPRQTDIDAIMSLIEMNNIKPVIGKVFRFEEIGLAHEYLEKHYVSGKLVVVVE